MDAMHREMLALAERRDAEEQKFTPMLAKVRELQDRWRHDYAEFLRLRQVAGDLQRLTG
jgi:hypothetical protein